MLFPKQRWFHFRIQVSSAVSLILGTKAGLLSILCVNVLCHGNYQYFSDINGILDLLLFQVFCGRYSFLCDSMYSFNLLQTSNWIAVHASVYISFVLPTILTVFHFLCIAKVYSVERKYALPNHCINYYISFDFLNLRAVLIKFCCFWRQTTCLHVLIWSEKCAIRIFFAIFNKYFLVFCHFFI